MENVLEKTHARQTERSSRSLFNNLLFYLFIGIILFGSGVVVGKFSAQFPTSNLPPFPSPTVLISPNPSFQYPANQQFRQGEAISFSFIYPLGWSAFSDINGSANDEILERFRLDPDPIWNFPHFIAFVEGKGYKLSVSEFNNKVKEFSTQNKSTKLDWKTGQFQGECFTYDTNSTDGMWGEVKGNIKCFVFIPRGQPRGRGYSGDLLFEFETFNGENLIEKIDPDKTRLKTFFSSLKPIIASNNFATPAPYQTISPSKDRTIPTEIKSTLPTQTSDGQKINAFFLSDDLNYVIFATFIRTRGAGLEYDFWFLNRTTKEELNLSKQIRNDTIYQQKYSSNLNYDQLFLVFNDRWRGDNPVFSISDGWSIVGEFWEFDIKQKLFNFIVNQ